MSFSNKCLAWFDLHGRQDLPWQQNKTPYRVWVSEIMLQQTQVQTVIPYYLKFMASFPTVSALACATQDSVLAHWSGLGYYARGRNLHKSAQLIMSEFGGVFPTDFDGVLSLPGVGRSTAGAILAIAQQQRFSILDGNVKRVLCRFYAVESWSGHKKTQDELWLRADNLLPETRVADYTQAMMDLGATVCKRAKPLCETCPLSGECRAFNDNRMKEFPFSKPKKAIPTKETHMLVLKTSDNRVGLIKRPQTGIWGGLWSLLEFEGLNAIKSYLEESSVAHNLLKCVPFKHVFSHYQLWIIPVICRVNSVGCIKDANIRWVAQSDLSQVGLPSPVTKILETVCLEK